MDIHAMRLLLLEQMHCSLKNHVEEFLNLSNFTLNLENVAAFDIYYKRSVNTQCSDSIKHLKKTQKTFQQRIQQREKDVQQLREAVESHKRSAQTAVEDSERIFTELIRSIERSRSELIRLIRDQEKAAVSRAEGRLERLEQEINDLRRRDAELEQLSHTQDHIQFLQSFQSLSAPLKSTDINDDPFSSLISFDVLKESVHQLRDKLEDFCKEELKKISDRVTSTNIDPRTREDFLQYSHQLTLDLNTVNKRLHLSENNRVITYSDTVQSYPDHPDRFDYWSQVLCRESVCGRCYWELEWSGNLGVYISVSYKSISRKGDNIHEMAEARFSQDELMCAVCLDLLKDPVTIHCGHSYCKSCITSCWDQEDQMRVYSCPQCRQTFSPRPALGRNTMLAELVEKLKKNKLTADCYAGAGDVQCDVCTGSEYKAVKSCLVCLNSYCQNHLEQHESFFKGKKHNLTDATGRLQEMICQKHDKVLEVFCRTDQKCICVLCMDEHKNHKTVSAAAQLTETQKQLKETQETFQQRIQQREKDVEQLRETVESHKRSAQTAVEDSERIFTELIRSIERSRSELIRLIRDQEKAAVSRAEGRLERLKQEINDLRRRDAELEQLSHTQDHIQFLQSFQSLSTCPESTDENDDPCTSLILFDGLGESVHQLRDKLEDSCKEELKKISDRVTSTNIDLRTRNDFLQYLHQLTLDPNTKQLKEMQKTFQQRIQQREKDVQQLREAVESHKKQLKKKQKVVQQQIQQGEKDVQQLREAVESHKRSAQTPLEDSERIFTELIRSIERRCFELIQLLIPDIRDQEKAAVSRAEGRLERLEQEINDLRRSDAELEQLSHTQDHIQFLQRFQSFSAPPESTDENDDPFSSVASFGDLRESVHQLRDKLQESFKVPLKKISDRGQGTTSYNIPISSLWI
ncbi:hypothetical protein QQF64_021522 [Cirrhinus molitorella]|uniref:Uncharacterized protein n=1 Tax=Cirrhinus molitorella TaxID=172907 RepID=A0ABR3L924_9TELE